MNVSQQRIASFLEELAGQKITQQQIAARTRLPAQYLSDIKHGRRPVTELVARRLGQEFGVNYAWLVGTSDIREGSLASAGGSGLWLPLFPHPIEGEPRAHSHWTGVGVELSGAAAAKVVQAKLPYVLEFGHDDHKGRLRKGDLVLISQAPAENAEISVVRFRKKLWLARTTQEGGWSRVANGTGLAAHSPVVGHCLGIVWSSLLRSVVAASVQASGA